MTTTIEQVSTEVLREVLKRLEEVERQVAEFNERVERAEKQARQARNWTRRTMEGE